LTLHTKEKRPRNHRGRFHFIAVAATSKTPTPGKNHSAGASAAGASAAGASAAGASAAGASAAGASAAGASAAGASAAGAVSAGASTTAGVSAVAVTLESAGAAGVVSVEVSGAAVSVGWQPTMANVNNRATQLSRVFFMVSGLARENELHIRMIETISFDAMLSGKTHFDSRTPICGIIVSIDTSRTLEKLDKCLREIRLFKHGD
jgi:hypothetical protein